MTHVTEKHTQQPQHSVQTHKAADAANSHMDTSRCTVLSESEWLPAVTPTGLLDSPRFCDFSYDPVTQQ